MASPTAGVDYPGNWHELLAWFPDDAACLRYLPLRGPQTPPHGAEVTRERLLQAAHELLYERLDSGPSVAEIGARSGANGAMVKYCFGNKDGLFAALMERVMSQVGAEVERLTQLDMCPSDKLRLHIEGLIANFLRYPYINRLMNERLNSTNAGPVGEDSSRFAVVTRDFYRDLVLEGERLEGWRKTDPELFFFTTIGACEFVFSVRAWLVHAFGTELDRAFLERFTRHATELVLSGLRP